MCLDFVRLIKSGWICGQILLVAGSGWIWLDLGGSDLIQYGCIWPDLAGSDLIQQGCVWLRSGQIWLDLAEIWPDLVGLALAGSGWISFELIGLNVGGSG